MAACVRRSGGSSRSSRYHASPHRGAFSCAAPRQKDPHVQFWGAGKSLNWQSLARLLYCSPEDTAWRGSHYRRRRGGSVAVGSASRNSFRRVDYARRAIQSQAGIYWTSARSSGSRRARESLVEKKPEVALTSLSRLLLFDASGQRGQMKSLETTYSDALSCLTTGVLHPFPPNSWGGSVSRKGRQGHSVNPVQA